MQGPERFIDCSGVTQQGLGRLDRTQGPLSPHPQGPCSTPSFREPVSCGLWLCLLVHTKDMEWIAGEGGFRSVSRRQRSSTLTDTHPRHCVLGSCRAVPGLWNQQQHRLLRHIPTPPSPPTRSWPGRAVLLKYEGIFFFPLKVNQRIPGKLYYTHFPGSGVLWRGRPTVCSAS